MSIKISRIVTLGNDSECPPPLAKELRRADSFIRLGVLAAHNIFEKEGCLDCSTLMHRGLFIGSSYGPMEANLEVLEQVANGMQTSPTLFSHSVFNGAAGYLSRIFKMKGCAVTITDFGFPFFQALQLAMSSIKSGQSSSGIVLQIETFSELLANAQHNLYHQKPLPWQPGVCAWLLSDENGEKCTTHRIEQFSLETRVTEPLNFLQFQEELNINGEQFLLSSPLEAGMKISETLLGTEKKINSFTLSAPHGEIHLTTSS